jgi:hypothetical protein
VPAAAAGCGTRSTAQQHPPSYTICSCLRAAGSSQSASFWLRRWRAHAVWQPRALRGAAARREGEAAHSPSGQGSSAGACCCCCCCCCPHSCASDPPAKVNALGPLHNTCGAACVAQVLKGHLEPSKGEGQFDAETKRALVDAVNAAFMQADQPPLYSVRKLEDWVRQMSLPLAWCFARSPEAEQRGRGVQVSNALYRWRKKNSKQPSQQAQGAPGAGGGATATAAVSKRKRMLSNTTAKPVQKQVKPAGTGPVGGLELSMPVPPPCAPPGYAAAAAASAPPGYSDGGGFFGGGGGFFGGGGAAPPMPLPPPGQRALAAPDWATPWMLQPPVPSMSPRLPNAASPVRLGMYRQHTQSERELRMRYEAETMAEQRRSKVMDSEMLTCDSQSCASRSVVSLFLFPSPPARTCCSVVGQR